MKRNAGETDDAMTKKIRSDGSSEFRFVIEKRQQGLLIGKGGSKITHVREESGVIASIIKANEQSLPERILVLQGTVEQCAHAWALFAQIVVEFKQEQEQKGNVDPSGSSDITVKLLVDQTQVGAVIGKGGATIRQTQADTSARVQVSNDPLPGSTEKTVSVVAASTDILQNALQLVLGQVAEYPMRPGTRSVQFVPGMTSMNAMNAHSPFNPYGNAAPTDPYGQQNPYSNFGGYPQQSASSPQTSHVQKIVIPTICAGGVIGKGGSRIRDIQAQSGCTVRIADAITEMPTERVVTLEGSNEGISIAIQLIRHAVEASSVPVEQ